MLKCLLRMQMRKVMQKGSCHKSKFTLLNGSVQGLAVQDHQIIWNYSAPKPGKKLLYLGWLGKNIPNHCSKIFHEVDSLQKLTTYILFSFSLFDQYQPMSYSVIHCNDLDLGVGEEAEYSMLNHILTCGTTQLLPTSRQH